jgi:hypothetical protein
VGFASIIFLTTGNSTIQIARCPTYRGRVTAQVRITDSRNFTVSERIAAALVEVEPGAMRELHWHPNPLRHGPLHREHRR